MKGEIEQGYVRDGSRHRYSLLGIVGWDSNRQILGRLRYIPNKINAFINCLHECDLSVNNLYSDFEKLRWFVTDFRVVAETV
jgi:hypothetical protein